MLEPLLSREHPLKENPTILLKLIAKVQSKTLDRTDFGQEKSKTGCFRLGIVSRFPESTSSADGLAVCEKAHRLSTGAGPIYIPRSLKSMCRPRYRV